MLAPPGHCKSQPLALLSPGQPPCAGLSGCLQTLLLAKWPSGPLALDPVASAQPYACLLLGDSGGCGPGEQ